MQDAEAFAALYEREAETVLLFVTRRTLDAEVALDITAETFAQAFTGRRSFRGTTEPEERAWLFTIARRQIGRYLGRSTAARCARRRTCATDAPSRERRRWLRVAERPGVDRDR
jgi:RNA polymerase sigma-70 factor (ECF subfamily)